MHNLDHYLRAFCGLNVNRTGEEPSPHKPCMLLAALGLAEAGELEHNEIRFGPALLERYARFFAVVRRESDHANPYFPFFHLRSDGFWHLQARPGRELALEALDSARSLTAIDDNIAYAYLDADLHALVLDERDRATLRDELVIAWFGIHRFKLQMVLQEESSSDRYETALRERASGKARLSVLEPSEPARSTAFRRIVCEIYDYRCAASGWRIILPDSRVMVEAAHLIPFSEAHDDDPCNGIALAPSYHWALDAHIIAPGPDYKWYVTNALDERVADNQPLLALKGKLIILPQKNTMWPKKEALAWRLQHLLSR